MHEIAHTGYSGAWTRSEVVYRAARERGNGIRAVVAWARDLRRRCSAPSRSSSTYRDRETARSWDEKKDSLLFYFSPTRCSLSNPWLTWILLWCGANLGRQRDIDRRREILGWGGAGYSYIRQSHNVDITKAAAGGLIDRWGVSAFMVWVVSRQTDWLGSMEVNVFKCLWLVTPLNISGGSQSRLTNQHILLPVHRVADYYMTFSPEKLKLTSTSMLR